MYTHASVAYSKGYPSLWSRRCHSLHSRQRRILLGNEKQAHTSCVHSHPDGRAAAIHYIHASVAYSSGMKSKHTLRACTHTPMVAPLPFITFTPASHNLVLRKTGTNCKISCWLWPVPVQIRALALKLS